MEAILPIEVEVPSFKVLAQTKLEEAKWDQACYKQLNMIDEKCMIAICHRQLYQQRVTCAFNKKVHPRHFEEGELVLMKRNTTLLEPRGKFAYKGQYVVKKAFLEGALILADMDGEEFQMPMNSDNVIHYYA